MKKITFNSFLILFTLSAYVCFSSTGPVKNKVNAAPFYTQDFGSGIPGSWQNNDDAGQGVKWHYTTTGAANGGIPVSNGTALNTTGTTAANGYAIFDSDDAFPSAGDGSLITAAISCTGKLNVHLTFNEYFAQWDISTGTVEVSNNGTTWTTVYHAETGLTQNQTTDNANAVDLNISSLADNKATVYIRFHYVGTAEYFWMIDDIGLYEFSALDGGVTSILAPVTTCGTLTATETVSVRIKNFGSSPLVGTPVSYSLDGTYTVGPEIVSTTINPGDSIVYNFTGKANLTAPGSHTIVASTTVIGDATSSNDASASKIYLGPHPLVYTQGFEIPTEDISGWNFYDGNTDGTTWLPSSSFPRTGGVCADFSHDLPTNAADDWLFSPCLDLNDASYSYLCTYYDRTFSSFTNANLEVALLTAQNPSAIDQIIDPVTTVSNLAYQQSGNAFSITSPGIYYIGWHVTNTTSNTSLKLDDINVSFYIKTPLTADQGNVIVYPNPNAGTFTISNLKSFDGMVQVTVLDMMGRSVYEQSVNGQDKIALTLVNEAVGVYTVRISNAAQVLNKRITITK